MSPRRGSGSKKLPYVPSENILLQKLCYLIHCQESTLPGIVAAEPEGLCLTHFISLEIISVWLRKELDVTCCDKI